VGFLEDAFAEIAAVEALELKRQQATARARSISVANAAKVNDIADRHPFMQPGILLGLARVNPFVGDDVIQRFSDLSTRRYLRDHPGGAQYGDRVNGPAIGGYPHGWSTNQFNRTRVGGGPKLSEDEIESRVQAIAGPNGWDEERTENYRQQLRGQGEVQYLPKPTERPSGGGGLIEATQALTGTAPTTSQRLMQTGGPAEGLGQDVVRGAAVALDAPVQEVQGQVRNLYALAPGGAAPQSFIEPQSDLGVLLTSDLNLDDAGSGFFVDPESEVAQERRRREAKRGQIEGHNVTLGRWVADWFTPFAADTKPWMMLSGMVDLGVQVAGDPTTYVLGGAGKAVAGRKLIANPALYEKAGLWSGVRRAIAGPDAYRLLDSEDGAKAVSWLTGETDPYRVFRGLNRKVNLDLATELADTRTLDETRTVLRRELGKGGLREVDTIRNAGFGNDPLTGARRLSTGARHGRPADMPIRSPIDVHDKDVVGSQVEKILYNMKATDDEVSRHVSKVARSKNPVELNAAIRGAFRDADGILARAGVDDPRWRDELTRLHKEATETGSQTWFDSATAQRQSFDGINVGGEVQWDASAHLYNELAPRWMSFPDARMARRAVSDHKRIMKAISVQSGARKGQLRLPLAAAEAIQNEIWKPFTLVTRIAWPVRVIGEEQVRMAAAGYDSMFNHPISFLAHTIGRKQSGALLDDFGEADAFKSAMSQTHGGWVDRAVSFGDKHVYTKGRLDVQGYSRAWGAEVTRLANDPVAKYVANADSLDDAKTWFTRGAGNKFRGGLAQAMPGKFDTLDQADEYIGSIARRIRQHTGGHTDLLEAVRTGKFRGKSLSDGVNIDRKFVDQLDGLVDEYGPEKIIGDRYASVFGGGEGLERLVQSWDRGVDKMFGWLMTNPTNKLSRSPTFRQAYWREAERLIGFADEPTKQAIIARAGEAQVGSRAVRRMGRARAAGDLTIDDVDFLAKGHALDETKGLLYDLTRKSRTADAMRVVFPFAEAWKEVITTWFGRNGLVWKNPKTIRRFQQLMQGAQGEELGEFMGAPDGEGFFWTNAFGEEVFIWPGSQLLTDKLLGAPMPLTGRVQGLSMFGTIMPGLGPVAQVPVGWLAQNKPGPEALKNIMAEALSFKVGPFGTVQEQILPFGSVGAEDQAEVFSAWNYMPPWVKTAGQAMTEGDINGKQWNTAVMEVAGALYAQGGYGDSVEERNRLLDDAAKRARGFYVIKALAAVAAPAAPDREWMLETNSGEVIRAAVLAKELRAMRDEDFQTADARFLEKYGPDVMAVLSTPMTTSSIYNVPTTQEGVDWVMEHPGIEDDLPNTFGFFAPEGGNENFQLYNANFRKGAAIRLDPRTWIKLLGDTKGNVEYAKVIDALGDEADTEAGRAYARMRREEIWDEFPAWRDEGGTLNKSPGRNVVEELYAAVRNPATRDTDAGRGLAQYLEARDVAVAHAEEQGRAWPSTAQDLLPVRLYLHDRAQEIIGDHPGFKPIYDFILSRETEELEEQ
jgi:hypothetical protein